MKKIRQTLTLLVALILVTAFTTPASATLSSTSSSEVPSQVEEELEQLAAYEDASGEFDFAAAKSDPDTDLEVLQEFSVGYEIGGGTLTNVTDEDRQAMMTQSALQAEDITALASCNGANGHAVGTLSLDSCNASALSGLLAVGAGVAAVAGLITAATGVGAVVAGSIAAVLTIYSGLTTICNAWGNGIHIFYTNTPPMCWSQ